MQPVVIVLPNLATAPADLGYVTVTLRDGSKMQHFAVLPDSSCKVCRGSSRFIRKEVKKGTGEEKRFVCECVGDRLKAWLAAGSKAQEQLMPPDAALARSLACSAHRENEHLDCGTCYPKPFPEAPAAIEARREIESTRQKQAEERRANLRSLIAAAEAEKEQALVPHRSKLATVQQEHASLAAHAEAQREAASRCTAAANAFREHAVELRRRAAEIDAKARDAEKEAVAFGIKAAGTSAQAVVRQHAVSRVEGEIEKIAAHHDTRIRRLQRKLKGAGGTVEAATSEAV